MMEIARLPRLKGENYITTFCIDDCLATVCKYYGKDIIWAYFNSINVKYKPNRNNRTYQNLYIMDKFVESIQEYCGIKVEYNELTANVIQKIIEKINNGIIVIVIMDAFYCPWDPSYCKQEYDRKNYHSFVIEKYDVSEQVFIGTDPYYKYNCVKIDCEKIRRGYNRHIEVYDETKKIKFVNAHMIVDYQLSLLSGSQYWLDLYQFADDINYEIKNIDIFSREEQQEYWNALYMEIARIEYRCYYFSIYLTNVRKYLDKNKIDILIKLYMEIFDEWCVLAAVVMKNIIKATYDNLSEIIKDKIKGIVKKEQHLMETLINRDARTFIQKRYAICITRLGEFISSNHIDIGMYCNNKGIVFEGEERNDTDFTGYNEFFLMPSIRGNIEIDMCKNISFNLCREKKDNICCNRQVIDMNNGVGKALLVVGCCEWGSYSAEMQLEYKNGEKESAIVSFGDCDFSGLEKDKLQNVALFSKFFSQGNDKKTICAIYYSIFELQCTKLNKLILPECTNMHIFAISILV